MCAVVPGVQPCALPIFDQLELEILGNEPVPVTGILSENVELAEATYDLHGNFAVLALAAMEEAAELAIPVMTIADGSHTLERARREIAPESGRSDQYAHHYRTYRDFGGKLNLAKMDKNHRTTSWTRKKQSSG